MPSFGLVVVRRLQAGADLRHRADHTQGARANSDWDGAQRGRCCGRAPERERFAHANPSIALVGHQATGAQLVEMAMRAWSITHGQPPSRVSCAVTFSQSAICREETRSGLTPRKRHLMASG